MEKVGDRLEGQGRFILYGLLGLVLVGVVAGLISWRNDSRDQEARQALGRAIQISEATIGSAPAPGMEFSFPNKEDRSKRAVEEFNNVAAKYGEPFRSKAKYLGATNLLTLDRNKGLAELEAVQKDASDEVAAWAKFALAQSREAYGEYDAAAVLYNELAQRKNPIVPADLARERLAAVYEKQGKKIEAVNILYSLVEASRAAKDKEGKPIQPSSTAREAEQRLQTLDPARFEQLPPAPSPLAGLNL
ncbi:MAG: hypothetical protein WKF84_06740 [Pyrinomonadaceae bacterium]